MHVNTFFSMPTTNTPVHTSLSVRAAALLLATVLPLVPVSVLAQSTPAASETDESKASGPVSQLTPFTVNESNDEGYSSQQTMVGSRSAKDLIDLPANISIINHEMISDFNAGDIHELLKYGAPGVGENQAINDDVNIRGFRSAQSLRDGVTKQTYKSNPLYDVERIEVIKGPGAMLLGSNDFLGGGINFVTRRPTMKPASDVEVTFSDDGKASYTKLDANSTGPLTVGKDFSALYRVTVGGANGSRDKDIENVDQKFIGGGLQFLMGANTTVTVNAYNFVDNGYHYWDDFLDLTSTEYAKLNKYSTKTFSPGLARDAYWNLNETLVNFELVSKLTENGTLRAFGYYSNDKDHRQHIRGIDVEADNYTLDRQDIPLKIDHTQWVEQVDYLHRLVRTVLTNDFSAGLDYSYTRHHQALAVINPGSIDTRHPDFSGDATSIPKNPTMISNKSTDSHNFSYYLQDNVTLFSGHVILVGGLRWFNSNSTVHNYLNSTDSYSSDPRIRTHKYGIVVKPLPDVSLYYTNAQNVFPQVGFTDYGDPLKNQDGKLNEFGLKVEKKLTERLSVYGTVAHFDMALTNDIIFDSLGNTIQSGEDTSRGWEVEVGIRAKTGGGTADLVGTYYQASTFSEAQNGPSFDAIPWSHSLLAKYAWTSGTLRGLMIGGGLYTQGTKHEADIQVAFPTTYNLFARYEIGKRWGLQFNWDNVTDKRYVVAVTTAGLVQSNDPGTIRVQLRYHW